MRYLITFSCYGARLHGDERGSVDLRHNAFGGRMVKPGATREAVERRLMKDPPFSLDEQSQTTVLATIKEVCAFRGWNLLIAHVRTKHVHVVVEAETRPEPIMNAFKSYASRRINILEACQRRHWARHGSTRYLWSDDDVTNAIRYVAEGQGDPLSLFMPTGA